MSSDVKWIKLSTQMFEDEKIRLIESMPEADTILIIWVKLLSQAGKTNASGYIYLAENIPYTDEMLATIFNRPLPTVRLALSTLKQFGMIEISEDQMICISNWEKHQNIDGLQKIREQNRLRKQKERENKKLLQLSHDSHVTVTDGHATELETETDKENNKYSPEFETFWNIYPNKKDKKGAYTKFKTALKSHSLQTILKGTRDYAKECEIKEREKGYIKHPKTFLGNDSFLDEFETTKVNIGTHNKQNRYQPKAAVIQPKGIEQEEYHDDWDDFS